MCSSSVFAYLSSSRCWVFLCFSTCGSHQAVTLGAATQRLNKLSACSCVHQLQAAVVFSPSSVHLASPQAVVFFFRFLGSSPLKRSPIGRILSAFIPKSVYASQRTMSRSTNNSRSTFTPPAVSPSSSHSSSTTSISTVTTTSLSSTGVQLPDSNALSQAISRALADSLPALLSSLREHVGDNTSMSSGSATSSATMSSPSTVPATIHSQSSTQSGTLAVPSFISTYSTLQWWTKFLGTLV